jgi:hypothetical protein
LHLIGHCDPAGAQDLAQRFDRHPQPRRFVKTIGDVGNLIHAVDWRRFYRKAG